MVDGNTNKGGMLCSQKCVLIWNRNNSCWWPHPYFHMGIKPQPFNRKKEKLESICCCCLFWSRLSNLLGTTQWAAPGGSAPEFILRLQKMWLKISFCLIAGPVKHKSSYKFALSLLLTIISEEPYSYKLLDSVTVIEQEVSCATSVSWLFRLFAPFEHLFECAIWVVHFYS